ncbi:hypothetical protein PAAL109150_01805 [Paenibacillus alkaliterrae]|uniref:hypothetical protein n=1 Tax=Paenibacillus alkaliterrae TaxID=320909 RepID=UPI0039EFB690
MVQLVGGRRKTRYEVADENEVLGGSVESFGRHKSNAEEAALLKTDAYRRKCAAAIIEGIAEVFALQRKEAAPVSDKVNVNKRPLAENNPLVGVLLRL